MAAICVDSRSQETEQKIGEKLRPGDKNTQPSQTGQIAKFKLNFCSQSKNFALLDSGEKSISFMAFTVYNETRQCIRKRRNIL